MEQEVPARPPDFPKPKFERSLLSSLLVSTLAGGVIGLCFWEFEFRLLSSFGAGAAYGFTLCLVYHLLGPLSRVQLMVAGACSGVLAGAVYDIIWGVTVPGIPSLLIGSAVGWFMVAAGGQRIRRILEGDPRALYSGKRPREETAASPGGPPSQQIPEPQTGAPGISRRQFALGIVLGVAIGLLVDSTLVLLFGATIIYFVVFSLGAILIAPIWIGIRGGIALVRRAMPRDFSWPALSLIALLLWPTVTVLPFGVQILRLRAIAYSAVPAYPGAHLEDMKVKLGDKENVGDRVYLLFSATADTPDVVEYYRRELGRRGWEEGPKHFIETKQYETPYWFQRRSTSDIIHIRFEPSGGSRKITYEVVYGL